jgi:putative spermidine/putrescine transport system permease protein
VVEQGLHILTETTLLQAPALAAPAARGAKRRSPAPALLAPGVLFVSLFLLLPLCVMFRYSLNRFDPSALMVQAVTGANYVKFLSDPFYQGVLWTTLWTAALSTAIALVTGFPVAYYLVRTAGPLLRQALLLAVLLPLLMGNAVRTAAWMVVLGERGALSTIAALLGITDKLSLMYTPTAVVIGLVSVLLPFMVITLQSVLDGLDSRIEEAAANLGASPWRCFVRVVLPLAMPGILAGTALCFVLAMNAYATPVLLGGPTFKMMAPQVYDQVTKAMNWPFGTALAFILMAVTLTLTICANLLLRRHTRRWA